MIPVLPISGWRIALSIEDGSAHKLPNGLWLVSSYHCSRYNIQTNRLTQTQFTQAVGQIAEETQLGEQRFFWRDQSLSFCTSRLSCFLVFFGHTVEFSRVFIIKIERYRHAAPCLYQFDQVWRAISLLARPAIFEYAGLAIITRR